ncbi:MAG: signal recognition particle-docking protein FtsY, partial [Alloalcanivorax venustensis]
MNDEVSRDDDRDPAEDSARDPGGNEPRGGEKKAGLFSRMFGKQPQPSEPESDKAEPAAAEPPAQPERPAGEPVAAPEAPAESDGGFWTRMKQGMSKTSKNLGKGLADLLVGAKEIDDEIF